MPPTTDPGASGNGEVCTLLHIATLSGVLSCLLRHFRASLASLPLLGQPLGALPVGTWSADSPLVQQHASNGPRQVRRRVMLAAMSSRVLQPAVNPAARTAYAPPGCSAMPRMLNATLSGALGLEIV